MKRHSHLVPTISCLGVLVLGASIAPPLMAGPVQVAAVEIPLSASGLKRLFRTGCYEVISVPATKTGGAQAGCHMPSAVAPVFQRLDAIAADSASPLISATSGAGKVRSGVAPSGGVGGQLPVVVIRAGGSRWLPANDDVAGELLAMINGLPSENQWHGDPQANPQGSPQGQRLGKGPQFVAVSRSLSKDGGRRKFQASLFIDGRWWCSQSGGNTSVPALSGSRHQKLSPLSAGDASARLSRILQGARSKGGLDDDVSAPEEAGVEMSVELMLSGRPRSSLFPSRLTNTVVKRFAAEMARQSPLCALP